jgi:cell division septation protein DedD
MIKFLIITFNAFLFFIISIFSGADGISITSNLPKTMSPGQEVEVEVKITKGGLGGFAKFQLEMPEGFTATEVDSKGANYSFATGLAKWVWPALPTESDVVIKFKLKADAAMSGAKTVAGKFSYVENNAKQVVEMPAVEIMVGGDGAVATENNSTPTNTTTNSTPTVANTTPTVASTPTVANTTPTVASTPTTEVANTTPTVSLNDEPGANVTVIRNIKAGSNADEHLVEVKISKGSIKGFAKFSDDLPAGYTAKSVNTSESSFSVADGKIKFVWVTIPTKEEITISYLLSGRSMSMVELTGEFSYLANDQSKKFIMQKVTIPNTPSAEIAQTPTSTPTVTETPTNTVVTTPTNTEVAVTTNTVTPTATETPTNTGNNNTENTATNITENRAGSINYRVQIGAFSNANVTSGTLARKFGVKGTIISEMQAGLNKFMVGNHNEYKDARDQRETIKPAINSAFVVAYNGAKRVTVQEALMLTNQKWFK